METRRQAMKKLFAMAGGLQFGTRGFATPVASRKVTDNAQALIYRAVNGPPAENLKKVINMMGGIETLLGREDVVVIKPNAQWWNQGAPNLAALKAFVELVMARPGGFNGEVVLAENCHRGSPPPHPPARHGPGRST